MVAKGKLFAFNGKPLQYEGLPDGTTLHEGMDVECNGEAFTVDTRPCPECIRTTYGMLVRGDGTAVCLICGEVGLMIDVRGRAIRARSRSHQ